MTRTVRNRGLSRRRLAGAVLIFAAGPLLAMATVPAKGGTTPGDTALQCKVLAHLAVVSGSAWDERDLARMLARSETVASDAPPDCAELIAHRVEADRND